jgi:hypothetical protein
MVHVFEVLHPEVVENLQVNIPLDLTQNIAAKRLRLYVGSDAKIPKQLTYRAIEKLSDIGEAIPPALTPQDTRDLRELEEVADPSAGPNVAQGALPQTAPFDPELDAASSPPPQEEEASREQALEEEEDPALAMQVDEAHRGPPRNRPPHCGS